MASKRANWPGMLPFASLRFGLLAAATDRTAEAPAHWQAGVTWESFCPDAGGTYDPCFVEMRDNIDSTQTETSPVPDPPTKTETGREGEDEEAGLFLRAATPFTVYAKLDCSPPGFWERAQELGTTALTRVENHQVERIFDTGIAPRQAGAAETVFPHLRADEPLVDNIGATLQTTAQVVTNTPVGIVQAMGLLEQALADCYHGRGVIHVPVALAADLASHTQTVRTGATLETQLGNRVALGTGYSGASPSGVEEAGVAWVYATGNVFYARGEVRVHDPRNSFNRNQNTLEIIAERNYVMGWDCCHLAIPVDISGLPVT